MHQKIQIIPMKIHKTFATTAAPFGSDNAPNRLSAGASIAPDPTGGAYSAPPDLLAGLRGPTSKGRRGEGRGKEGECAPPMFISAPP